MPFLHVTTRIEGRKDDDLLTRKSGRALFPTFLILDADGEILLKLDRAVLSAAIGNGGPTIASLGRKLDACERYVALRTRVAGGDASAKVDLAVTALEIGKIDAAAFDAAVAGVELRPEQAKAVVQIRANAICEALVAETRSRGQDPESEKAATREFVKLYEKGTHPDSDSADMYWWLIGTHAKATGNAAMIERSIEGLEATGGRARFGPLLAELDAELKRLKPKN